MTDLTPREIQALEDFKRRVQASFSGEVLSFTLFGSRARCEGHKDSDIDVLVLVRHDQLALRDAILDIANDILLAYEIDISPSVMSQERFQRILDRELLFGKEIQRDGRPL